MEPEAPDLEKWGGKWDGHAFKPFNKYKNSREYQNRKNSNPPHPSDKRKNPRNSVTMGRLINRMLPGLLSTLTKLNPKFHYSQQFNPKRILTKPSERVHNQGYDNKEHNYLLYVNDLIASPRNRYRVIDLLGQGSFGQAAKCLDETTGEYVAVKIVKSLPAYHNQALVEVKLLQMINQHFDPDTYPIVKLLDYFVFRNHLCLVFELLSVSLYELIRQNQYRGLSLKLIVLFLKQLLISLDSLSQLRIMHCDLKPENILLEDISGPSLKLIDFGSACFEFQAIYTYIQSRFYRSPEVLLGMPYRLPIDVWSLGCVCFELFVGLPLFPGQNEHRMLYRISKVLGMPPFPMLAAGKQTLKYFNKVGNSNQIADYQLKSDAEFMKENNITQLPPYREYFKYDKMEDIIMYYEYKTGLTAEELEHERTQRRAFIHMLQQMLRWDPDQRWTPAQLLTHPLITGQPFTGEYTPPPIARQQRIITRTPAQPQHPHVIVSSHNNAYPANVHQQPAQSYFDQLSPTGPSYMNPQYIYGQQGAPLQPQQQYTQQLGTSPSVNSTQKRQNEDRHAPSNKNKNNNNPPRKNSHQPSPNNKQTQQRRNRSYSQSGPDYNTAAGGNNAAQSTHHSQRQGRGQTQYNQQHREHNNNQTRGRSNTTVNNPGGAQNHVNNNQPAKKHMTPPHKPHRNRSNSSPPTPIEITNATPNQGKLTTHNTPQRPPQQQQRQTYSIRVPRQKFASDDHGGASRSWEKGSMATSPHTSNSYQQYTPVKSSVPLMTAVDPSPRPNRDRETRDEVMKDSNVSDQNTLPESAAHVGESPQSPVIPQSPQDDMMELSKSTLMDKVIEEEDDSVFSSESDTMVDPSPRDGMMSEQTTSSDWAWDPTYSDDQLLSNDQSAVMMGQSPPTHQYMVPQQYQQQYVMQQGNAATQSFLGMSPYDRGMYYPPQNYSAQYNPNYPQQQAPQRNYYPPKRNK